ncbi:MAG: hypothetical protein IPN17_24840 [Deltaproteobacteria bacterium]|nr:hypothetical protein [Deltaproteobacteria bacterium]
MRELSHDAYLAGGLVERVARDGVADRTWLDCELGSLAENRLDDHADPLDIDPARRDRWRTLATEAWRDSLDARGDYETPYWLLEDGRRVGTIALTTTAYGAADMRVSSFYVFRSQRGLGDRAARARPPPRARRRAADRPPPRHLLELAAHGALLPPRGDVGAHVEARPHAPLGRAVPHTPDRRRRRRSDALRPARWRGGRAGEGAPPGRRAAARRTILGDSRRQEPQRAGARVTPTSML